MTDGWASYFVFEVAQEAPKFASYWPSAEEFLRSTAIALALPVVLLGSLLWRARRRGLSPRPNDIGGLLDASVDLRVASLLVLFVIVGAPAAVYFRLKIGSDVNAYIGVVWALGMLGALAYRHARVDTATALVSVVMVVALFGLAQRPTDAVGGLRIAPLVRTAEYPELPRQLLDYARGHLVYQQVHSDLNVEPQRSIYPSFYGMADLLSTGRQPMFLVDALIERRFDAVAPFRFPEADDRLYWDIYASGGGRRESSYFWKLNEVIRHGYAPAPGLPAGYLGRRPGPASTWLRSCFAPFDLAGQPFVIRAGGGLWCEESAGVVALRATPAPVSEIHADDPVAAVAGALAVTLARPGTVAVTLSGDGGRGWRIEIRSDRERLTVRALAQGREVNRAEAALPRSGQVSLAFTNGSLSVGARSGRVTASVPTVERGDLALTASRESGARLDFRRLGLR